MAVKGLRPVSPCLCCEFNPKKQRRVKFSIVSLRESVAEEAETARQDVPKSYQIFTENCLISGGKYQILTRKKEAPQGGL
jgi:hypothetical protein